MIAVKGNFRKTKTTLIIASESFDRLYSARREEGKNERKIHFMTIRSLLLLESTQLSGFVQLQLYAFVMQFSSFDCFTSFESRCNLPCEWLFFYNVMLLDFGIDENLLEELGLWLENSIAQVKNFFWQHFFFLEYQNNLIYKHCHFVVLRTLEIIFCQSCTMKLESKNLIANFAH